MLFYKIWNKEKNESGYYLININAWGYEYNYLVNYRLYKNFYRLLNLTLDKPIQKYAAFVKSKYAYINFKRKFIFYPISYKELEKWKFNYKKIQNKYKYFNTFYNKYEILTIKILVFINSHIEYLTDIEYKKLQNKVYKLCITSDINLQNFILGLYNAALNKYEIHKLKYYKKDSGIYINTRRSKNRVFKSFNIIVEQYRKCYKYERKFIKKIV